MTDSINWLGTLVIRGADATVFSHSQLANDVKSLPVGHWQWNALLQIQGRVVALLLLIKRADDEILLVSPLENRDEVRHTLSRYVLRSRVRIETDDRYALHGLWPDRAVANSAPATGGAIILRPGGFELELGGQSLRRLLGVRAEPNSADAVPGASLGGDRWRADDIADGIPWIRTATQAEFVPQALGLGRLSAYSVAKGCYPGQEIVARMHFLGRNKRTLKRFRGDFSGLAPGAGTRLAGNSDASGDAAAVVLDAVSAANGETEGLCVTKDASITDLWWPGPWGVRHLAAVDRLSGAAAGSP